MSKKLKNFRIDFTRGKPSEIYDNISTDPPRPSQMEQKILKDLSVAVKGYLKAVEELLSGKYAHLKQLAPRYLADAGKVLVFHCLDGIIIRFEPKIDKKQIVCCWLSETILTASKKISENVIHCHSNKDFTSAILTDGVEIKLFTKNPVSTEEKTICSFRIGYDVVLQFPEKLPPFPDKPYCLLSAKNNFEIQTHGILVGKDENLDTGKRFLTRTPVRLPVGWECIEIYPFFERERWKPEYATVWAEKDLLASLLVNQIEESRYQSLDPKAAARKLLAKVLKDYKALLDSNPDREEKLQCFLRDNYQLLCPASTKVLPKLALGSYITDFIFREAAGDYLLVEIERPDRPLFIKNGHASSELNHAKGQILDWKRYIEDNLSTVQKELGLTEISSNPNSLIVIGRSSSLSSENKRKLIAIQNQCPKVKIMTYDDIYDNAKAVIENLLGPLWDAEGNTQIYYLPNS